MLFTTFLFAPRLPALQYSLPISDFPPLYTVNPSMKGRPEIGRIYKIVFDLNTAGSDDNSPNPGLVIIARLLNTYAQFNILQQHRKFVVVLRNDFVTLAEEDTIYRQQHSGRPNPNRALMKQLAKAGVVFVADGSSLSKRLLFKPNLQEGIQIHVSADLTFLDLEAQGFVYTSTKSLEQQ